MMIIMILLLLLFIIFAYAKAVHILLYFADDWAVYANKTLLSSFL